MPNYAALPAGLAALASRIAPYENMGVRALLDLMAPARAKIVNTIREMPLQLQRGFGNPEHLGIAHSEVPHDRRNIYQFSQRPADYGADSQYFESVLQLPKNYKNFDDINGYVADNDPSIFAFSNPGQLGHIRGRIQPGSAGNTVAIEEVQADPLRIWRMLRDADNLPLPQEFQNVHENLAKAAIRQAAKGQAQAITFPNSASVLQIRDGMPQSVAESIYDGKIGTKVQRQLDTLGIPTLTTKEGLRVELPKDVAEFVSKNGLNFAKGGLAASNGPFNPKNGIMKGGLDILNPKSQARGPLNIDLNMNNMIARGMRRG